MGSFKLTAEQESKMVADLLAADDAEKAGKRGAIFAQLGQDIDGCIVCDFHFIGHETSLAIKEILNK